MIKDIAVSSKMDDIKSAREIAMEKLAQIGEPTEEERLRWKYVPEGEKLAASYMKENCNLVDEVGHYQEKERKYVIEGIDDIVPKVSNENFLFLKAIFMSSITFLASLGKPDSTYMRRLSTESETRFTEIAVSNAISNFD